MRPVLLAAALVVAAALPAHAEDGTPVEVEVGRKIVLCKEGLAVCPAGVLLCDDPRVASIENGPDGPELKGISPGKTLCSVSGPGGAFRRVLRVTVTRPEPGKGGEERGRPRPTEG